MIIPAKPVAYYRDQHGVHPYFGGWQKIADPPANFIAVKTSGWTVDQFTPGGLEVDFSAVVPTGTRAVKLCAVQATVLSQVFYRKSGDTNISNTPGASGEVSHRILNYGYENECTIWLSSDLKAEFAVWNVDVDLYIPYPSGYLL